MILQSLAEYYRRLDAQGVDISKPGYAEQKVHFELILNPDGTVAQVNDLRIPDGKKLLPKITKLPTIGRSGAGFTPQFSWDNIQYVLGRCSPDKPQKDHERAVSAFNAFRDRHVKVLEQFPCNETISAFLNFLKKWDPSKAESLEHWNDIITQAGANIVFRIQGVRKYLHEQPEVTNLWMQEVNSEEEDPVTGFCLVNGEIATLARLHPVIKGVDGSQAKGGSLVAFNATAFESYNKTQSYNAPTSQNAAFEYTTALNYLLRKTSDNHQRMKIGETTVVFWAERETPLESMLADIFETKDVTVIEADSEGQDAAEHKKLAVFLDACRKGKKAPLPDFDESVKFYVLGLSPNNARLAVRFWYPCTVGQLTKNIGRHFADMEMVKQFDNEPDFPGIWQLLRESVRESKDIPPLMEGRFMLAVLNAGKYPLTLMRALLNRIQVGDRMNYLKASVIKAILTRNFKENITMGLDKESDDVAYLTGRLFAVLEKVQEEANPGINATIKDRFFSSASATPLMVFPRLLRLSQHHLSKLENPGRKVNFEKLYLREIIGKIKDFPAHMSLHQQGKFALGYYHQRVDFFTSKQVEQDTDTQK